jgi:predicted pyridoxine 5'-phosphate oxidase superfamily flavin-nucleotide-binding protein
LKGGEIKMEIGDIKDKIEKATIAVASVNSEGKPHNIAIMYAKVKDGKVIITNNYMKTTIENIKNNPNISLVFWEGEKGWRINGNVDYYDSGEWLDFVKSLEENKREPANGALVININEIKELG